MKDKQTVPQSQIEGFVICALKSCSIHFIRFAVDSTFIYTRLK